MRTYFIILLSLYLISSSFSIDIKEEEGVLVLDDKNFDAALKQHQVIMVEFYAPWCGHCKELAPHYAKAAQALRKDEPPVFLAKVDATVSEALAKRFNVEGFPTIKLFTKGEPEEYNGGRTEDEIVQFIRKKSGPASRTLNSVKEVTDYTVNAEAAVIFFGSNENLNKLFLDLAKTYDDVLFGDCKVEECLKHFNVNDGNVIVFRNFEPRRVELKTNYTAEELKSFIDSNSTPLVSGFTEKSAQLIFGKNVPGLFFYRSKGSKDGKKLDEIANGLADELKGKIQVIVTDLKDELEQRLAEYIGITDKELPSVRIHDTRQDLKKFNMDGEITRENVLQFVKDWLDGKLVAKLKSEDVKVTESSKSQPVLTLVGKNFNEIALDPTKDVFVKFYAPWCGHCKQLAPIWEDLAKKVKAGNPNLIIAKCDSTANDVEGHDIQGFPTLKFFKKDSKTAIDYEGENDLSGLTDFLQQNIKDFVRPEGIAASKPKPEGGDEENPEDAKNEGKDFEENPEDAKNAEDAKNYGKEYDGKDDGKDFDGKDDGKDFDGKDDGKDFDGKYDGKDDPEGDLYKDDDPEIMPEGKEKEEKTPEKEGKKAEL